MPNKLARPFHIGDIICYVDGTKYAANYNNLPEPPPRMLLRCLVLSEGKPAQQHRHKGFKFDLLVLTSNFIHLKNQRLPNKITEWIPSYGKVNDSDRHFWELESPIAEKP